MDTYQNYITAKLKKSDYTIDRSKLTYRDIIYIHNPNYTSKLLNKNSIFENLSIFKCKLSFNKKLRIRIKTYVTCRSVSIIYF